MILNIIKFLLFVIVNLFGWFMVPFIVTSTAKFNLLPDTLNATQTEQMMTMFAMYQPIWAIAAIASIGFFFTRRELRAWLILAPLYTTAIFGFGVLGYFYLV